ncbi:MAG TPA: thiol-disulfide isomerase [Bryobacteraceae bacterium]|nr:thiol-disulfide isomerase [Bryobacteraceae bacterium]
MTRTCALGLLLSSWAAAAPTFSKDVAPILYQHCAACHRPNDIAPMSLLDYKSARPWAKAIREAVLTRKMPPWFADPHYGKFSNDARLSDREVETVRAWVDGGSPEGDSRDLPKPPSFVEGWRLGKPDIVIDIGEDYHVRPGLDSYEHFTVPTNFSQGKWIRAAEIRPGNRRVVHHVHVNLVRDASQAGPTSIEAMVSLNQFLLHDGKLTRVRADAPVVNDACAADAPDLPYLRGFQEGALASFLPGRPPDVFPDGSAKWVPPGSKLEFVVHYARTSRQSETDRTSVGFYLAPAPPARVLRRMDLRNFFFRIPAGAPNHEVRRCYTFEKDKLLLSITPHMHYRGKDVRYDLTRPDGRRETLLYVPHYNFGWQLVYRFQDPIRVEKGSVLTVTTHYDNSPNNPANPDPTAAIRWGDKSEEEMMTSWIEYFDAQPAPHRAAESAELR